MLRHLDLSEMNFEHGTWHYAREMMRYTSELHGSDLYGSLTDAEYNVSKLMHGEELYDGNPKDGLAAYLTMGKEEQWPSLDKLLRDWYAFLREEDGDSTDGETAPAAGQSSIIDDSANQETSTNSSTNAITTSD